MLRNCPTCGRLLTSPPGVSCPDCEQEEDRAYEVIEAHLADGGTPTLAAVVQATGVAPALIRRLVRRGRICLSDAGAARACVVCGEPLLGDGQLCPRCASRMGGADPRPNDRGRGRMYSAGDDPRGP